MKKLASILILFLSVVSAAPLYAAPKFEISGWIPYWRMDKGVAEATAHLDAFTEINPFGYTVTKDGRLKDNLKLTEEPWKTFIASARVKKVRIVPTVMWGNGDAIHLVLSNKLLRDATIKDIAAMVKSNGYDGVDIDFEAKLLDTKNYFSTFLKDLSKALGNKWLQCDVEARTPAGSRYDNVPLTYDPNEVANDYKEMNKYCDRIRIMAYDQGRVDLKLDRVNTLYAPVSDAQWVEKLVNLATINIDKKKLIIGIPTYGYEYQVAPSSSAIGGYTYKRLWAFNPKYATDIAQTLNITPQRTNAGELGFMYYPTSSSTPTGVRGDIQTNYMTWSDAKGIEAKVQLAKKMGVRGVAIFKIDGGADPLMWSVLK